MPPLAVRQCLWSQYTTSGSFMCWQTWQFHRSSAGFQAVNNFPLFQSGAMESFQVVGHHRESTGAMLCEFAVLRAVDVRKTALIFEIRHPGHAIRTPWARRLAARPFQREPMLECIGILRHGPNSHLHDDWCTTVMVEPRTILPAVGSVLWEP